MLSLKVILRYVFSLTSFFFDARLNEDGRTYFGGGFSTNCRFKSIKMLSSFGELLNLPFFFLKLDILLNAGPSKYCKVLFGFGIAFLYISTNLSYFGIVYNYFDCEVFVGLLAMS